ncbi:hypothetical protein [Billgrantia bachuensis]|uniref:hypothetical protein n=1 Tax=Billgrantia bachuensis TaxID=2717286 RepID=UPI0030B86679
MTGYLHPKQPNTLFLWQIDVQEHGRGQGLAMEAHLRGARLCQTAPENSAGERLR